MGKCVMGIAEALEFLRHGRSVRLAPPMQTKFRLRRSNTEVWMKYPGLSWAKYGTVPEFMNSESKQMFTKTDLGTPFANV